LVSDLALKELPFNAKAGSPRAALGQKFVVKKVRWCLHILKSLCAVR
jgi:hypothetical protein